ncbi:MAG: phytanoyl-CoA dioxygenase family protein [Pseudomonadota bacterium]
MNPALFEVNGCASVLGVLTPEECTALALRVQPGTDSVGNRCLLSEDWCAVLAARLRQHAELATLLPTDHVAVQCTYFEKSLARNWLVPVHQDLSIPVAQRVNDPVLQGWSQKDGAWFVQAPLPVLEQLLAVRIHLDACTADDGPLRVVPGSHTLGCLMPDAAMAVRNTRAQVSCPAGQGGALVMRPLLLHASSKSTGTSRRRVLHFVFGPRALPHGLQWHTAV